MALEVTTTKTVHRYGDLAAPVLTATGAAGAVSWSVDYGFMHPATGNTATLSPLNESRVVTVTADDGAETVETEIEIQATFPFQPDWGFERQLDERDEISEAEDGSEAVREVGNTFAVCNLAFNDRDPAEAKAARLFRVFHRKSRYFWVQDLAFEELVYGRFDSAINESPVGPNGQSYSFVFKVINWESS